MLYASGLLHQGCQNYGIYSQVHSENKSAAYIQETSVSYSFGMY
jgi:hypothetical protein